MNSPRARKRAADRAANGQHLSDEPAPSPQPALAPVPQGVRSAQYRRAKLRHFFFTTGPDRLMGGRLSRRHLSQEVEIREVEIRSPRWPAAFDGMRIAHVSDLHVGDLLPVEKAIRLAELVRDLSPDLLACTGDVVDLDNHLAPPVLEALASTGAPLGSMLVLGNHDHLDNADCLVRMASSVGLTVLRDEEAEIVHNGERLLLAGIDWARTVQECSARVRRSVERNTHVLLAHNPKAFIEASRIGVPLTLAGHTHGGQVARRRNPNHNLAMAAGRSRGLYQHGDSHLYVTTGVGAWFPLRLNCPPEIALITMRTGEPG